MGKETIVRWPIEMRNTTLIRILELRTFPVVFYLLLEEVEALLGEGLAHQLNLEAVRPVELHEELHRPKQTSSVMDSGV